MKTSLLQGSRNPYRLHSSFYFPRMSSLLSSSLLPRLFPLSSLLQDEISRTKHTGGVEERAVIKDETRRRTRRGKRRRRRRRGKRRGGRGEERGLKSKWKNKRGRRRKETKKEFSPQSAIYARDKASLSLLPCQRPGDTISMLHPAWLVFRRHGCKINNDPCLLLCIFYLLLPPLLGVVLGIQDFSSFLGCCKFGEDWKLKMLQVGKDATYNVNKVCKISKLVARFWSLEEILLDWKTSD